MPDFSTSIAALRRWESFSSDTPLPSNFAQWRQQNASLSMELSAKDPELYSLLAGTAPAGLVADTLQGKLSPIPATPEQRQSAQKKAEVQKLVDSNPYKSGNLTEMLQLESLDPQAAKSLRRQSGVQTPIERDEAQAAEKARHQEAFEQTIAAGRAHQMQQAMQQAALFQRN